MSSYARRFKRFINPLMPDTVNSFTFITENYHYLLSKINSRQKAQLIVSPVFWN